MSYTTGIKNRYTAPSCESLTFTVERVLAASAGVGDMPVKPASAGTENSDFFSNDGFNF